MPLVISDPVRPENLTVSMSDSMSSVLATIKSSEDNNFELEFVVPSGTVPDEGIGGAFFVTDAVTKQKVNGYINIVRMRQCRLCRMRFSLFATEKGSQGQVR
ncbi:MAG: hypothetical protein ACF8AM_14240 [Rhodopirellula sp. JB055]|uniref:hypothetical protein n=1 Tax=Rhodopirellula sp. JB055 TaxID=3342846 RepID=UPI00370BFAA2